MAVPQHILDALKKVRLGKRLVAPLRFDGDSRFGVLNKRETYYKGTIFDSRPFDWNGEWKMKDGIIITSPTSMSFADVECKPVKQRTPHAPYHLGRVITNRFVELLFGEKRFPRSEVPFSHDTEVYLNALIKATQMKAHMIIAGQLGGAVGSVITMFKVVDGHFRLESFNTKWCHVEWEDRVAGEMDHFLVSYPIYEEEWDDDKNDYVEKLYILRRLITKEVDVTFLPQEAEEFTAGTRSGIKLKDPKAVSQPDPDRSFFHGFGFNPGVFIPNIPVHDSADGDCSFEGAQELIERISENLSAIHSAMQGNLDPTLVLKITPEDYKKLQTMGGVVQTGSSGAALVVGDKGDAKYIEVECQGIEVAMKVILMQVDFALKTVDCVIPDPEKLTGAAQSAAAMKLLFAAMLAKCDILRTQYGEYGIKALLSKMLKAYHMFGNIKRTDEGLKRQNLKPLRVKDPQSGKRVDAAPEKDIELEDIELIWGEYFTPTAADVFQAVEAGQMASGGKAITTQKQAATFVSPYLGDPDLETTLVEMKREAEEDRKNELEMVTAGAAAKAKASGGVKPKAPKKPAASAGSGK